MELNKNHKFVPDWEISLNPKGKWVYHDYEDDSQEEWPQSDVENQFEDFFETNFVDGIQSFAHGTLTSPKDPDESEDAIRIIAKDEKKAPIVYIFANRGREEEALWISMFKLRTRTFPPALYAD